MKSTRRAGKGTVADERTPQQGRSDGTRTTEDDYPSPPLMPSRPGSYHHLNFPLQNGTRGPAKIAPAKDPSWMRPYILEPPAEATKLSSERTADIFPWAGNHPEDVLSDQATKQGYYDKVSISQNETGTGRTSLWPIIKHKSGLQILSSLFVSVLEQRQSRGRIASASTFKPPPRVTLTDAKREAWLRDLANPSVPLRRLSRTIPHGIRGRMLLDQCLSKGIPTARAVWLIKCVGANEIRAFKRKGVNGAFVMGGESKYFRDWTVLVEQFMDSLIAECATPGWKDKATYTIRLCAHLYTECLLDRSHYFDWLLKSLEICTLDALPIWLLIIQIFWDDLVRSRKFAKRLGEALLCKLSQDSSAVDENILAPVLNLVSQLVLKLLTDWSRCFIMPTKWSEYRTTLLSCIERAEFGAPKLHSTFRNLDERNQRLLLDGSLRDNVAANSIPRKLIQFLDSLSPNFAVEEITPLCLNIAQDPRQAINILLKWASTPYREELYHLFIAVRVLRQLHGNGIDIDSAILDFLAQSRTLHELRKQDVFQIISELVSSRDFSVGRYLQWIIARGGLLTYQAINDNAPCDVRLLAELPTNDLPAHLINLRQMLLAGSECDVCKEQHILAEAKSSISALISRLAEDDSSMGATQLIGHPDFASLSRGMKAELGNWLRQMLAAQVTETDAIIVDNNWTDVVNQKITSEITFPQFSTVRTILEVFNEFSTLADVLKIVSISEDPTVLASVADTINYHFKVFGALGVLGSLYESLVDRYRLLRGLGSQYLILLASLLEIMPNVPEEVNCASFLLLERSLLDQKFQANASSPVSDHAADMLQAGNYEGLVEVDRLLTNGSNIDKLTFARLFAALIQEVELSWAKPNNPGERCARSLTTLRRFDSCHFDEMIEEWLDGLLLSRTRPDLNGILPALIGAGCFSLSTVIVAARKRIEEVACEPNVAFIPAKIALETISLLLQQPDTSTFFYSFNLYRFLLEQRHFVDEHAADILHFFEVTVHFGLNNDKQEIFHAAETPPFESLFSVFMRRTLLAHQEDFRRCAIAESTLSQTQLASYLDQALNILFVSCHSSDLSGIDLESQLQSISQMVDPFNLPFCQLKLLVALRSVDLSAESGCAPEYLVRHFLDSIGSDNQRDSALWADLLSGLSDALVTEVREQALKEMLSTIPSSTDLEGHSSFKSPCSEEKFEMFLGLIKATMMNAIEGGTQTFLNLLIEKFGATLQRLQSSDLISDVDASKEKISNGNWHFLGDLRRWIITLLRLVLIHHGSFRNEKVTAVDNTRLAICMASLLIDDVLQQDAELLQFLFDVLATLVDELSDDARINCIKFFQSQISDWRLQYLFDYHAGPNAWLHASSKGKLIPYPLRPWEMLAEPTPNVGDNDASLNLTAFQARKI
ncbi:hypothetical protein L228DRAFT_270570 [Xylona heveae TC161]|uniref:Mediator of RNA polymerase II transcription subunit 12 n=1 Tax=Xylona heveae (strain CBS 132557 / TC161) TaxID=1328760 RepID=A0A165AHX5_XYLHT|nr:hypothetical protein L228DRAFT_270570 [Xylona heveae TC161]KZF20503.1 hypothetical protein L228DRAFT_270570 [Xylona heveae TC161]